MLRDCGVSSTLTSDLVPVALRRATMPSTGPVADSPRPVTEIGDNVVTPPGAAAGTIVTLLPLIWKVSWLPASRRRSASSGVRRPDTAGA